MLKKLLISVACSLIATVPAVCQTGQIKIPVPVGYVNDFAHLLTPAQVSELEQILTGYEQKTTNEVVVVTLSSLEGRPAADVALTIGREWKIGKKGPSSLGGNNGVVILLAPNERELFIAVGTGLEGTLTDLSAGRIRDEDMKPYLARGSEDWYAAIKGGALGVIRRLGTLTPEERQAIAAREAAERERKWQETKGALIDGLLVLLGIAVLAALIVVPVVLIRRRRRLNALRAETRKEVDALNKELIGLLQSSAEARGVWTKLLVGASESDRNTVVLGPLAKLSQAGHAATNEITVAVRTVLRGVRNDQEANTILAQTRDSMIVLKNACAELESMRSRYVYASVESGTLLIGASSAIAETEKSVSHDDVDEEVRVRIPMLEAFHQRAVDLQKSREFLKLFDVIDELGERCKAIQADAKASIEFAGRARREGDKLFASLPGRVELARKAVDHSDVSAKTKAVFAQEAVGDYHWLTSRCTGQNSTVFPTQKHIFQRILALLEKLDLIIESAKREKDNAQRAREEKKRREDEAAAAALIAAAQRSSHDDSSGGGGFGGFGGGGGFSGGGAGGKF